MPWGGRLGLSAVVYRNNKNLPFDPDKLGVSRDDLTGEYYCANHEMESSFERQSPWETRVASYKRLGNISRISLLREQSASAVTDLSIVLSKVLYSGTHGGDTIKAECFGWLEDELSKLDVHAKRNGFTELSNLVADMNELITAARMEGNPVVFI